MFASLVSFRHGVGVAVFAAALGSAVALSNGQASTTTSALSAGTHTITATYSGNTNYAASTGTLAPVQTVNKASAAVVLGNPMPSL